MYTRFLAAARRFVAGVGQVSSAAAAVCRSVALSRRTRRFLDEIGVCCSRGETVCSGAAAVISALIVRRRWTDGMAIARALLSENA